MKRTLVGIVLAGLYATASAQGYVGAVVGLSNYDIDCNGFSPCDKKGKAAKLYAGTQFKKGLVDTSRFKLDTVEVSYIRFGGVHTSSGTRRDTYEDENGDPVNVDQNMGLKPKVDAVTFAGVGRFIITPALTASAKVGLAYVNTTMDQAVGAGSWGSDTKSKIQHYLGLGIEYAVTSNLKVVGNFDVTRYDGHVDGNIDGKPDSNPANQVSDATLKGSVYQLGLGLQFGF